MPHINKLYDFVVTIFIVNRGSVLLVNHKRYDAWLPIGGHIELNEDPDQALYREIREECGLKVSVLAPKPAIAHPGVRPNMTPSYVDNHRVSKTHRHIAFIYIGKSTSRKVKLHTQEHREFKWFSLKELSHKKYALAPSIRFYCRQALEQAS